MAALHIVRQVSRLWFQIPDSIGPLRPTPPPQDRSAFADGPDVVRIDSPHSVEPLARACGLRGPTCTVPLQDRSASADGPGVVCVLAPDSSQIISLWQGIVPAPSRNALRTGGPDSLGF